MLTMRQKKAVTRELPNRYPKARKKEKIIILNEFTLLTGYNRSYAARVLRKKEILAYLNISGEDQIVIIFLEITTKACLALSGLAGLVFR